MRPHLKLFLSSQAFKGVFGGGKWMLLKAIMEEGSIQKAAKKLGRGYRKAWGDIKIAEHGLGIALIKKEKGGKGGGRTIITKAGLELLKAWDKYQAEVIAAMEKSYKKHIIPLFGNKPT